MTPAEQTAFKKKLDRKFKPIPAIVAKAAKARAEIGIVGHHYTFEPATCLSPLRRFPERRPLPPRSSRAKAGPARRIPRMHPNRTPQRTVAAIVAATFRSRPSNCSRSLQAAPPPERRGYNTVLFHIECSMFGARSRFIGVRCSLISCSSRLKFVCAFCASLRQFPLITDY